MNSSNDGEGRSEYTTPYDESSRVNNPLADKKGTTSMILGIIAIVSTITGLLAPVALVLGIIAIVKSKKYMRVNTNAKAGFVLGIISVIIACLIIIGFLFLISNGSGYHTMHTSMYTTHSLINGRSHGSIFYQNGPHMYHKYF